MAHMSGSPQQIVWLHNHAHRRTKYVMSKPVSSFLFTKFIQPVLHKVGLGLIRYARKHMSDDTALRIQAQRGLALDLPQTISSVGILSLTEVSAHHINTIVGSRSHLVHFNNGGVLQFAYNGAGELIELKSQDLSATASEGVLIYAIPHAQAQDKVTT